ncbi:cytochrome c oxidase assembly factor Coa1 family protein [Paenibacillus daejeonensis]|uniref:cytochrome c oxidase assembly factor Coa1 family protein n=1 Tax=Paenibacillus daejeonensis TaxID=135193 RepID=UPI001FDEFF57|nr:cytochrome c oxidase assembly factor Coa1 family protein [Paenibacillus daejeonensis]
MTISLTFIVINWLERHEIFSLIVTLITTIGGVFLLIFKDIFNGQSVGKRIFNIGIREVESYQLPNRRKLIDRNRISFNWPRDLINVLFSTDKRRQGDIINGLDVFIVENKDRTSNIIRVLGSLTVIGSLFILGITFMIKQDASYKTAIIHIENDVTIKEKIGEFNGFGFFPSGSINKSNGYGNANYKIKVKGDKGDLKIVVQLSKVPNEKWKINHIDF